MRSSVEVAQYIGDSRSLVEAELQHAELIAQQQISAQSEIINQTSEHLDGLKVSRALSFAEKFGATIRPFLVGGRPGQDVTPNNAIFQEVQGTYSDHHDLTYVYRDPKLEELNGATYTEALLVHEETHAGEDVHEFVLYEIRGKKLHYWRPRAGFIIMQGGDSRRKLGTFLEEGWAAYVTGQYVEQELELPGGFTNIPEGHKVTVAGEVIPARYLYWSAPGQRNLDRSAWAARGLELLMQQDPQLLVSFVEARSYIEGLRDVAKRINQLCPGLYSRLCQPMERFEGGLTLIKKGLAR